MGNDIQIYADDGIEVTPEMKELTEKGIVSLRSWLESRREVDFMEGYAEPIDQALQRLDDAKVYFIGTGGQSVLDAIENGELHIVERKLKRPGKEACMKEIKKMLNSPDAQGQVIRGYIEEPAIIININNFNRDKDLTLDSLVLHEGTHTLGLDDSEYTARSEVKFKVNDGVKYDMMYYDTGEEVYARLMQLRYHLQLDPTHQFTVEDVAKLREECLEIKNAKMDVGRNFSGMETGKSYTMEELREIMQRNQQENMEEDRRRKMNYFNYKAIFERYSDEQIMNLLNETASLDPVHISDIDRDILRTDMQKDFALASAKDRVGEHIAPVSVREEVSQKEDVKQTTVSDELLVSRMNDVQYS